MSSTAENLRELLEREPFLPFRIVMTSGESYDVTSPNSAVLLKSEIFVAFPDGDHWALVPYLHIASIETIKNGRGRKRRTKKRK